MVDTGGRCSVCGMIVPVGVIHSCGGVQTFTGTYPPPVPASTDRIETLLERVLSVLQSIDRTLDRIRLHSGAGL